MSNIPYQIDRYGYTNRFSWRRLANRWGRDFASWAIRNPDILQWGVDAALTTFQQLTKPNPKFGPYTQNPKPKTQNTKTKGMAFPGHYGGRFKRKTRTGKSYSQAQLYEFRGQAIAEVWDGVSAFDPDPQGPVYIGFTNNPIAQTKRAFWAGVLKSLLLKSGITVTHQAQLFNGQPATSQGQDITYQYSSQGTANLVNQGVTIGLNDTFAQAVDALVASVDAVVASTVVEIEFQRIFLVPEMDHSAGLAYHRFMPMLDLKHAMTSFKMTTTVRIQNRTGANDNAEDQTTNIDANPLQGYMSIMTGNIVRPAAQSTDTFTTPPPTFGATNTSTGVITGLVQEDSRYDPVLTQVMAKPRKNQWAKSKSSFIRLEPGQIKTATISSQGSMGFNKFYNKHIKENDSDGQGLFPYSGKSIIFALEKTMETGLGTAVPNIGYYGHNSHCFWVKEGKPKETIYVQGTN